MNYQDQMAAMVEDLFKQAFQIGQQHPSGELVAVMTTWKFDAGTITPSVSWLIQEPE